MKSQCKECEGVCICSHNKIKSKCIDCGGSGICEHLRQKDKCVACKGSQICEHDKQKSFCLDCKGSQICEHLKRRNVCVDCKGSAICEHLKRRSRCILCGGSEMCEHNKLKVFCTICRPQQALLNNQRLQMTRIFKKSSASKSKRTIEYLGCSVSHFEEFIKSKMTEGMTFQNIQYDHIKPISAFDLEDEEDFLQCCHYTNFQPLFAIDNNRKNNTWTSIDEAFWRENICGKEYIPLYIPN
jgi:hypothetical protein